MRKPASEIEVGDTVEVPGWMLHEDLSGAFFQIKVEAIEEDGNWIWIHHFTLDARPAQTAFKRDESVRCLATAS